MQIKIKLIACVQLVIINQMNSSVVGTSPPVCLSGRKMYLFGAAAIHRNRSQWLVFVVVWLFACECLEIKYCTYSNMEFKTVRLIRTTVLFFTWINMVSDVIVQPLRSLALMLCVTHESVRDTGAQHVCVCSHVRTCVGSIWSSYQFIKWYHLIKWMPFDQMVSIW